MQADGMRHKSRTFRELQLMCNWKAGRTDFSSSFIMPDQFSVKTKEERVRTVPVFQNWTWWIDLSKI